MVSNPILAGRLAAGISILAVFCGCTHTRPAEEPPPPRAPDTGAAAPAPQLTATEAAIAAAGAAGQQTAVVTAQEVRPNAPMHYTVKKGDTLWGIAAMYLKDPWLWPEVWVINPQIPNPHLIFPGDTLSLAYGADGAVKVTVEQAGAVRLDPRLRSEPFADAIPAIPYASIASFLSRPSVMTSEQIRNAPYVLAFRDMHQAGGAGNYVYLNKMSAGPNARYPIMHIAGPLVDPDDGKVVGYEGIYSATALVQHPGEPTTALLVESARETLRGDRVLTVDANPTPAVLTPRPPERKVNGTIINVVSGTDLVGQFDVVVINRGKRDGLAPGDVLAIDHRGDVVRDLYRNGQQIGDVFTTFAPQEQLPDFRAGTLLVFKVYDRVSYGLVAGADNLIYVGDVVRNPDINLNP